MRDEQPDSPARVAAPGDWRHVIAILLKDLLFTILLPGTIAGWGPYWILTAGGRALGPTDGFVMLGWVVLTLGIATYVWCVWEFATRGRGTPAPIDPPRHLVIRGPYRFVRNPMYWGVIGVIAGWALLHASLSVAGYGVAVSAGFALFVFLVEEPMLERAFGPEYAAYRERVPRWLPRLPARRLGTRS